MSSVFFKPSVKTGVARDQHSSAPVYSEAHPGLTKRELFAAMALQGYISGAAHHEHETSPVVCAKKAVKFADALIAALGATPEGRDA